MRSAVPAGSEKMAHTLVYESLILQALPDGLEGSIQMPRAGDGRRGKPPRRSGNLRSLATTLPDGHYRTLPGHGHGDIDPAAVGPVLKESLRLRAQLSSRARDNPPSQPAKQGAKSNGKSTFQVLAYSYRRTRTIR